MATAQDITDHVNAVREAVNKLAASLEKPTELSVEALAEALGEKPNAQVREIVEHYNETVSEGDEKLSFGQNVETLKAKAEKYDRLVVLLGPQVKMAHELICE